MTNPIKGEVPLVLADGRKLTLILDMEALVDAESAYGKPMGKMLADAGEGFVGATVALLIGAAARRNPISRGEALEMLRVDAGAVGQALQAAVAASHEDVSAGGNAAAPAAHPAGKSSGRSGAKRG